MDIQRSDSELEELLESFARDALGLELREAILHAGELPSLHLHGIEHAAGRGRAWAAWQTLTGPVTLCGSIDNSFSNFYVGQVLWIEWWIGTAVHSSGWWRRHPKFPRDWIKGSGQSKPPTPAAER